MSKSANAQQQRPQHYGTIGKEYVRQRDDTPTRKRGFTLSVELITRLELFAANPKQSTNGIAERALAEYLDREEKRRMRAR